MLRRCAAALGAAVRDKAVERAAHRALAGLPATWTAPELVEAVARRRGRPITVSYVDPAPPGGGPCGMLLSTRDADYLQVAASGPAEHREQVLLHELAHLLLGHAGAAPSERVLGQLLPSLDPAAVLRVLCRTSPGSRQEREAELLATLLRWRGGQPLAARMSATFLGEGGGV